MQKHLETLKHKSAICRDKDVYDEIDQLFSTLKCVDFIEKPITQDPKSGLISSAETDTEFHKKPEENKIKIEFEQKVTEILDKKIAMKRKLSETKSDPTSSQQEKRIKIKPGEMTKMVEILKIAEEKPNKNKKDKKKSSIGNSTLEQFGIFFTKECHNKNS